MSAKDQKPYEGMYDINFESEHYHSGARTMSAGIFQWIKKSKGNQLKRSGAFIRIKGYQTDPVRIRDTCLQIVKALNEGALEYNDIASWPKTIMWDSAMAMLDKSVRH